MFREGGGGGVSVGVCVGVFVIVGVRVGVRVGVEVEVGVSVGAGVGAGAQPANAAAVVATPAAFRKSRRVNLALPDLISTAKTCGDSPSAETVTFL